MPTSLLVLIALLAACASAGDPGSAVTIRTPTTVAPQERIDLTHENVINAMDFAATREQVWDAMMRVHADLGFPVVSADEKTLIAKFQFESRTGSMLGKPTANYVDCGMGPAGPRVSTYRVTIRITEAVEREYEDRTRLLTVIDATARSPGMNADPVQCTSLGTLERQIAGRVAAQLN